MNENDIMNQSISDKSFKYGIMIFFLILGFFGLISYNFFYSLLGFIGFIVLFFKFRDGKIDFGDKYPVRKGFVYILFLYHRPKYKERYRGRRETYLGETERTLDERFKEHRDDIKNHRTKPYVSRVAENIFVLGAKPSNDCLNEENYWKNIRKLNDQQKKDLATKWYREYGKIWTVEKSRDDFGLFGRIRHSFHGV